MHREHVILGLLLGAAFLAHLATSTRYPMFRDEFYYLECADHMDWGYVDHPPLSIAVLAGWRALFGDSLLAVRFLPSLAVPVLLLLIWKIVTELGGGLFARTLAVTASFFAIQQRAIMGFYSMNAIDLLFWAAALLILARIVRIGDARLWILFGTVVGLGLMNKIGLLLLGPALVVAMLLTPLRSHFRRREFWIGGLIALLFLLPYILWQFSHGFATLEFMRNAAGGKNVAFAPHQFLGLVVLENNPLTVIVWGFGLIALLLCPLLKSFRALGWLALAVFVLLMAQNSKPYYAAGILPLLFAGGATALEFRLPWTWARTMVVALIVVSGVALLPFGMRILPPEQFLVYQAAIGGTPPASEHGHAGSAMPQVHSDCFGWFELTDAVAHEYRALPETEQEDCVIIVGNYGESGALNYHGRRYDLPRAYSGHNNNYFWGPPPVTPNTTYIVVVSPGTDLGRIFERSTRVAAHHHPLAVPEERDLEIHVAHGLKHPPGDAWRARKHFE